MTANTGFRTPITRLPMAVTPSVSVVVPTLNEERNIAYVLDRLPDLVTQVILVDGGSDDKTVPVARACRPDIEVVQQTRTGKGNALACGFAEATGDIVVMIDADGSTDPAEIPRFVDALCNGADFAKGSRFRAGGGSTDITPLRKIGNDGLNAMVNILFGTRYTDLCYGYNAFWRSVIPAMQLPPIDAPKPESGKLWGDGFEVETLMNIRVSVSGFRIQEVSSHEAARRFGESNLNTFRDGRRVLRTVLDEYRHLPGQNRRNAPGEPQSVVPSRPNTAAVSRRPATKSRNKARWLQSVSSHASAGASGALVAGRAVSSLLLGNMGR